MRKLIMIFAGVAVLGAPVCVWGTGPYAAVPDWESEDSRTAYGIALNDLNGDGWQKTVRERKRGDGNRHLFYVDHWPILTVTALRVNGTPVSRTDYCFDTRAGWFSLKNAPTNGANVEVDYTWSNRLDLFSGNLPKGGTTAHDVIYFNNGGKLNPVPGWISQLQDDVHDVAAADYDADGDVDVAIGGVNSGEYGHVKIYKNNGSGLERTPSWTYIASSTYFSPASLAWGDVDNDGYLELAVADVEEYFCVFKNNAGTLENSPSWKVSHVYPSHVEWGDPDGDGDLDLACAASEYLNKNNGYTFIYRNNGGTLENAPWWRNAPPKGNCGALAWGDVNGDGEVDLVKGINGSYAEQDRYTDVYFSKGGVLPSEPSWESRYYTFCNTSALVDCTGDSRLDLIQVLFTIIIYFNRENGLDPLPSWEYVPGGQKSCYDIRVGDVNGDGYPDLAVGCGVTSAGFGGCPNKLFLHTGNIGINLKGFTASACARGVALRWAVSEAVAGFNLFRESTAVASTSGPAKINAELITGRSPYHYIDADVNSGNSYRYWLEVAPLAGPSERHGPVECAMGVKAAFALAQNHPNPARNSTTVAFSVPDACEAKVTIYDLAGRKVAAPFAGAAKAGANEISVDLSGLAPGVYTYRLEAGGATAAKRMVVVK